MGYSGAPRPEPVKSVGTLFRDAKKVLDKKHSEWKKAGAALDGASEGVADLETQLASAKKFRDEARLVADAADLALSAAAAQLAAAEARHLEEQQVAKDAMAEESVENKPGPSKQSVEPGPEVELLEGF